MNKFIIATGEGIKIEVKQNLKKAQVEKVEKHFQEIKDFVSDFDDKFTITKVNKDLVLGYMTLPVVDPELIDALSKKSEDLMSITMDFINKLEETQPANGDDLTKDPHDSDVEKAIDAAFESLKKVVPDGGAFIMVYDPKEDGVHLAGNLNKHLVASLLLVNG